MDGLTSTPSQRWLARLSFVLAGLAIVIRGILGVVGVTVASARQAAGLLRGRHATGLSVLTTKQIEISADVLQIPVGVDGELDPDADAGYLRSLPGRAPRLGASRPPGRPRAEAAEGLGQAAVPRRHFENCARMSPH